MTQQMANKNHHRSLSVLISIALVLLALTITVPAGAESVLSDHYHINIAMANGGEKYIKFDGGGLNALHISSDPSNNFGNSIASDSQSGVFYLTDTGGRGFDDDGIILIAVQGDVPDDFRVHIRASGYTWEPSPEANLKPENYTHVEGTVDSTFTKADFAYGPQNWKPAGPANYPIYDGQDMGDTSQQFHLMFIDLKAGIMGKDAFPPGLTDEGGIRVEYSFENMNTFAAFNAYAWCMNSNQGQGISWTNRLSEAGSSGFTVKGVAPTPTTEPTTPVATPNTTATVTPTDTPTTTETTLIVTPTVTVTVTETSQPTSTVTSEPSTTVVPSTQAPVTTTTITTTVSPVQSIVTTVTTGVPVTSTSIPATVSTTPGVTVSVTTPVTAITTVPPVTATRSPEPSVSIPVLSTLFPSRVQTAVPTQAATSAQAQSPASDAGMASSGVPTVQATAAPSQPASQPASSSADGPVSTGDSSSSSSSDDYTGVGGTVGTTATPVPTTITTAQTESAAPTPAPTQVNTSTPVMTTPTPPFLDTGNQDEYSPLTIPGASAGKTSSSDRNSQTNFLSTVQSTIDRLSSSDLSLILLAGVVFLFLLLVFAGLIILVLVLLLLLVAILYLRQKKNLENKE